MNQVHEEYVLQHRDKEDPNWIDHQTALYRGDLMPEIYHLAQHGTTSKRYRVIRRTTKVLMEFNGMRELMP